MSNEGFLFTFLAPGRGHGFIFCWCEIFYLLLLISYELSLLYRSRTRSCTLSLSHTHTHTLFHHRQTPLAVMELATHGNLKDYLRNSDKSGNPLQASLKLAFAEQVSMREMARGESTSDGMFSIVEERVNMLLFTF